MLERSAISRLSELLSRFTPAEHAVVRWWPGLLHDGRGDSIRKFAGTLSLPDGSLARGVFGTMTAVSRLTAVAEVEGAEEDAPPLPTADGRLLLAVLDGPTIPLIPLRGGRLRLEIGPRDLLRAHEAEAELAAHRASRAARDAADADGSEVSR